MALPVALCLSEVRARYGPRVVLDGVSLTVRRGEIVGLLGPNGSGKSTTLAIAAGIREPASGWVAVEGVRRDADPAGYARRIGFVPQECALYEELTAADNLSFFGRLYGLSGSDLRRRVARCLARVRLSDRAGHRVASLSGGMKQRLNLAAALLHDPPVLLLDEPTAALDPAGRDALYADLARLRDDGHAILLSTHHLDEAELSCDRVAILAGGRVVADGPPARVLRGGSAARPVLYGQLRDRPPRFLLKALRQRLGPEVELEVTGRRLRLAAADSGQLGLALATVLAEGLEVDSYRSPSGSIERAVSAATPPGGRTV